MMDFITGVLRIKKQNESIMVVVDKLTKETHFILIKSTYNAINTADIFIKEIFRLHGIPKIVVTDRDTKFTSNLWKSLFAGMDTNLKSSIAYHPQIYGQTKQVN